MPLNQIPQINGQSFDHAGITLVLFGRKVHGLTAVEYDEQVEKVNNYGTGTLPVSAGRGKTTITGSITVEKKELEWLQKSLLPGTRIQDVPPFDIIVEYETAALEVVTHTLIGCEFAGNSRSSKAGDTSIEVQLPLRIAKIDWGNGLN